MSHPWMRHAEHGGYAQLPDIPYWRALGWEPSDAPPPPPDPTLVEYVPLPAPETEPTSDSEPSEDQSQQPEEGTE
jgi:hypothetical protein